MLWRDILRYEFLDNTIINYLWFAGILLFGFLFKTILSRLLSGLIFRLVKRFSHAENLPIFRRLLLQPLEVLLFLVFLYFAFKALDYPLDPTEAARKKDNFLRSFTFRTYQIFVISSLTWVVLRLIDFAGHIFSLRAERTVSKLDDQLVPFFKDFTKVLIVLLSFLVMLGTVFGVNVAGLVAGLGVGGLAIAFAAKESIENLLASFTIFLDQPFVVGDLVQVADITGSVEKIGFRSTRIRTLEKSFVTLPNKFMIDKALNNLSLRTFRRADFMINLTYDTTSAQMRAIIRELQAYIDQHPRTNQDGRIRFSALGASSKDIMVLYFVATMDWNEYIDVKEEINYKIVDIVERNGAAFAFPSQTVYLQPPTLPDQAKPEQPARPPFPDTDIR